MTTAERLHTRWGIGADTKDIIRIDSSDPCPWDRDQYLACLRAHECICIVAEEPCGQHECRSHVAGFAVYELHKGRLEILKMGGTHLARLSLIDKLKGKLSSHRRRLLAVHVDEYDGQGIRSYAEAGMVAVWEKDGIRFRYRIDKSVDGR